jgi:hypothetical protein
MEYLETARSTARSERRSASSLWLRSGAALASAVALVAAVHIFTAHNTSPPWGGGAAPGGLAVSKQMFGGLATRTSISSLATDLAVPGDEVPTLLPGFQASFVEVPHMDASAIQDLPDYMTYATAELALPVKTVRVVQTINYPTEGALSRPMVAGWRGVIDIEVAGDYTFTSSSNDGSHVRPQPLHTRSSEPRQQRRPQQPVAAFYHFGYYPDPREIPGDLLNLPENYYSTRMRYKLGRVAGGQPRRCPGATSYSCYHQPSRKAQIVDLKITDLP